MTDENNNWFTGIIAMVKALIGKLCRIIPGLAKLESESMTIQAEGMINVVKMAERDGYLFSWQKGNIDSIDKMAKEKLRAESADKAENAEHVDKAENAYDWIAHFIEKAKNTSNKEKQQIWANILARETKTPGSFSIRTIALVEQMDKKDMDMFTYFCQFVWNIGNIPQNDQPLIYDYVSAIYNSNFHIFSAMQNLDAIGLISYDGSGYTQTFSVRDKIIWRYYDNVVFLNFSPNKNNKCVISTGYAFMTQAGKELLPICGAEKNDEFFAYIMKTWKEMGYNPSLTPHTESGAK